MALLSQYKLANPDVRKAAARALSDMPEGTIVQFKEPTRTLDQNALLWALLSEVAKTRPGGREHTPDVWKALFMKACDHEIRFVMGLDEQPFPLGFKSSQLSVGQMRDLIEFIYAWGSDKGIKWPAAPRAVSGTEGER